MSAPENPLQNPPAEVALLSHTDGADVCNLKIYVVDGDASAHPWGPAGADSGKIRVRHITRAGEALRIPATDPPALFLVNMSLPDMSGLDLYALLKERWPRVPGYLFSDTYDAAGEIQARCAGSTLYFCKPLAEGWLSTLLMKARSMAEMQVSYGG